MDTFCSNYQNVTTLPTNVNFWFIEKIVAQKDKCLMMRGEQSGYFRESKNWTGSAAPRKRHSSEKKCREHFWPVSKRENQHNIVDQSLRKKKEKVEETASVWVEAD